MILRSFQYFPTDGAIEHTKRRITPKFINDLKDISASLALTWFCSTIGKTKSSTRNQQGSPFGGYPLSGAEHGRVEQASSKVKIRSVLNRYETDLKNCE